MLLSDAREAMDASTKDQWTFREPLVSVVGGLCRAAVDGAARQAMIDRAVARGDSVDGELALLGAKLTTRRRLDHVCARAGGKERLPVLAAARRRLPEWNQGSHGQLDDAVDLEPIVSDAEAACRELVTFDWSAV